MADSTPLLTESDSVESQAPRLTDKHSPTLDDMIEWCIGDFGWAQLIQAVLVSLAWAFDAQQTFITVFTDADPSWHCTQLRRDSCSSASNICNLPENSWAWDWAKHTSVVSEWALQCSGTFILGLPESSFFAGCLVGGLLLATLADSWLGRKNMMFLSCLVMSSAGFLTVFANNVWIYSVLRFVSGFGRATIGTSALVLSTELVGKKWRGQVGILGFMCFTLGFLSLPVIAYINRGSSWRNIYLWTSIPTIFYCMLVHFFVHESPRWLFVQGRREEAIATLKSMSPADNIIISTFSFSGVAFKQETWNSNIYSTLKILLGKRWAIRRLAAIVVVAVGVGMVYYGMPLGLGNLAFNLYVSVTLNALSELPASLVTFFLIGKINRRGGILAFASISGVCSVLCALISKELKGLQVALELVSFFSACTAFGVVLIYALELFPTSVRNSALSIARQALVLGGVFSPLLVAAGRENALWSYGFFGAVIGCCGLFVVFLPETRGKTLCDTIEEEEQRERERCTGNAGGGAGGGV